MHPTISKQTKAELLEALRQRYLQAPKADKSKVLQVDVNGGVKARRRAELAAAEK